MERPLSRAVLDTSVVIDLMDGEDVVVPDASAISVVTLGELRAGVLRTRDADARALRQARLRVVRKRFLPLPVDEDVAAHYGRALALARDEGRNAKATDLLIVATAAATDNPLHTRDERQAKLARRLGLVVHGPHRMIRLAVRVDRAHAELALAELLELAPGGVEEVDHGDAVEYAVYGPPGELPALPELEAAVGGALVAVTTSELPDDWSERWKRFHHPLVLGERLAVRPPWEPAGGAAVELVIDPAQAFGTGAHATTRLCLELLLELADADPRAARGPLLDLGCGSGVLAIAAAKLGWAPVVAVDFDPLSVEATRANAAVNDVALDVARCDLRRDPLPAAPTVLANLLRPLLLDYARRLAELPRALIASGLLTREADEIAAAFAAHGLRERDRRERGEWAALLLTS